jgi:hypothetical protein
MIFMFAFNDMVDSFMSFFFIESDIYVLKFFRFLCWCCYLQVTEVEQNVTLK